MLRLLLLSFFAGLPLLNRQEAYVHFKQQIASEQEKLGKEHRLYQNDSTYKKASAYLLSIVSDSMSYYWENTDWEFYGTSEIPGKGAIACGYFVTTVLRDVGFKINRVKLAETYSEKMIKALVKPQYIKRYQPYKHGKFIEDIRKAGDGLYIIGLDFHTGFIICRNKEVYFLHSNYTSRVMNEIALGSPVLSRNEYAVTGKISADTALIGHWLRKENADGNFGH
jgi:hypothetical protein